MPMMDIGLSNNKDRHSYEDIQQDFSLRMPKLKLFFIFFRDKTNS